MKGIIPAAMMNFLCEYNKKEIWQMFDCIGGSSIGGIIALGSAGTLDGSRPPHHRLLGGLLLLVFLLVALIRIFLVLMRAIVVALWRMHHLSFLEPAPSGRFFLVLGLFAL